MEMSQRRKLGDVASCGGGRGCGEDESGIDSLSVLPDHVAHHILSFLAFPDICRVCCVSKRCGELCMSAPALNFDEFPSEIMPACSGRLLLLSYLDRFLFHRGHNKIQSFRVRWEGHAIDEDATPCMCDDEHYRLNTWIQNAVRCNVEVLDLKTTLNINVVDMTPMVLRTPSFAFSSNLKFLKLEKVYIDGDDFFKWISHACKCIEDLHLRHLVGIEQITIFRSSLKRFSFARGPLDQVNHINISSEKLVDFDLCWTFDSPGNKSLNIDAPNLKRLKWIGNLMKYPSLGTLECLERAIIFLQPEVDALNKLHEVLWSLRRAPALFLNDVVIKASFRNGSAPASLYDTSCLCISSIENFVDELVPAFISFLRRTPNLSVLYIDSSPPQNQQSNTSGFSMDYWKLQDLAFANQVEHVTINPCCGSNAVELAKFLLKYAPNMHKMDVVCLPEDLKEVRKKLKKSKMVSNAVLAIKDK